MDLGLLICRPVAAAYEPPELEKKKERKVGKKLAYVETTYTNQFTKYQQSSIGCYSFFVLSFSLVDYEAMLSFLLSFSCSSYSNYYYSYFSLLIYLAVEISYAYNSLQRDEFNNSIHTQRKLYP